MQCRIVAGEYVLDDRESEADAAILPGPAPVYPKESFGQPWQVNLGDTLAGIPYNKLTAFRPRPPAQDHLSFGGGMTHGIRQQVGDYRFDLCGIAPQLRSGFAFDADRRRIRLSQESLATARQQRRDVDNVCGSRAPGAFEP